MTPSAPGIYQYTPDMPDASASLVDVVTYKGVLMARLVDDDESELHPVGDMSGRWELAHDGKKKGER